MMSWIMYVVRSIICGRAVKTLLFISFSSSWVLCFSKKLQKLDDEEDEEEEAEEEKQKFRDVLASSWVGQLIKGLNGSFDDCLSSFTEKTFLSIGYKKHQTFRL